MCNTGIRTNEEVEVGAARELQITLITGDPY